ncbi:MAG: DMT family transporter [Chloroflexia bacterium]
MLLYAGLIYLLAAAWLAPAAAATFDPANYRPGNIAAIIGLAVVPLGLGHTLYNAALRRIPAAQANVLSTLEVIGGTLLVVILLNERVSTVSIVGGAIVLLGVLAVVRRGD